MDDSIRKRQIKYSALSGVALEHQVMPQNIRTLTQAAVEHNNAVAPPAVNGSSI
jgi:hypothetical protein